MEATVLCTWGLCDNLEWGETQKAPEPALLKLHRESPRRERHHGEEVGVPSGWKEGTVSIFFLSCFSVLSKHSGTCCRRHGRRDGTENQYPPAWLGCNPLMCHRQCELPKGEGTASILGQTWAHTHVGYMVEAGDWYLTSACGPLGDSETYSQGRANRGRGLGEVLLFPRGKALIYPHFRQPSSEGRCLN